tara:strand:- start:208 stop:555 length:348 start_codon:yes stop_codon:yes gene_type:complete
MKYLEALRLAIKLSPFTQPVICKGAGNNNRTLSRWLSKETSPKAHDLYNTIEAAGFIMNITLELPMGRTFWKPADKKEALRLYTKEFARIGEIAEKFSCKISEVERMLKAEGQLL